MHLNIEDKGRMYENLVIISTYQDINSGPLQIQEHVKSHRFKE